MNDQTKPRAPDEGAALQGKVVLDPVLSVAQPEPAPAPAQRLEEASFERLDEIGRAHV